jgi:hypothetical protein
MTSEEDCIIRDSYISLLKEEAKLADADVAGITAESLRDCGKYIKAQANRIEELEWGLNNIIERSHKHGCIFCAVKDSTAVSVLRGDIPEGIEEAGDE